MSWYDINARFRPISQWPGAETKNRQRSRFKASWSDTLTLLAREIDHIVKSREIPVMEIAVEEHDLRLDGYPRANARPSHPGVILSLESKWGPLRYPCDTFTDWQDNVRAIALALEALRKVDRYGVTKRGEQYAGWQQLPPSGGSTATMTAQTAAEVLVRMAGMNGEAIGRALHEPLFVRDVYRSAVKYTHPDQGGSVASFQRLQTAKRVLDAHHGANP